jgi:hypothetical protein
VLPVHVHVKGLVPETAEAVPPEHKLVVGEVVVAVPLELPQEATIVVGAVQEAVEAPFVHVQDHGPAPDTADAVPCAQRFVVGAMATAQVLAEPHEAVMSEVQETDAVSVAPVEPEGLNSLPDKLQFQFQFVPSDVTVDAVLTPRHKLVAGAAGAGVPSAEPQPPTSATGTLCVHPDAAVPNESWLPGL